jgi:hypothetical protein
MINSENNLDEIVTYFNRNGFAIIRRCKNCIFWKSEKDIESLIKLDMGQCTLKQYFFAFTLSPNLYPFTRDFFLCENHKLFNEDKLEQVSEKIKLKDAIKKKQDIQ